MCGWQTDERGHAKIRSFASCNQPTLHCLPSSSAKLVQSTGDVPQGFLNWLPPPSVVVRLSRQQGEALRHRELRALLCRLLSTPPGEVVSEAMPSSATSAATRECLTKQRVRSGTEEELCESAPPCLRRHRHRHRHHLFTTARGDGAGTASEQAMVLEEVVEEEVWEKS